jgi:hypothetical protein
MSSVAVLEKASRVEIKDRTKVIFCVELLADAQRYRCLMSHRIHNFRGRIDFTEPNRGSNDHPIDEPVGSVRGIVCSPQVPYCDTRVFLCFLLFPAKTKGNGYMTMRSKLSFCYYRHRILAIDGNYIGQ